DVRDIHQHAQAVHLPHHLHAEIGEAIVVLDVGIVDVAGGIGPVGGLVVGQRHVADTQAVVIAQQAEAVVDGVSALDAHQHRQLVLLVGAHDVVGGEGHHHAI